MARLNDSKNSGSIVSIIFGLMFFGMGSVFMWFMGLKPLLLSFQADQWPQVACTITRSTVDWKSNSEGETSYKAVVKFSYRLHNQAYNGGSYDFDDVYSSGYSGEQKIASKYSAGQVHQCWVNPQEPTQAVLSKGIPGIVWFVIPFTSIFVFIGGAFLLGAAGLLPELRRSKNTGHKRVDLNQQGYTELKPRYGVKKKLLGSIAFALIWNGMVGAAVYKNWQDFNQGTLDSELTILISILVLVGIGLCAWVVHGLLALFNPRPSLYATEGCPQLGQEIQFGWGFTGNIRKITRFNIVLEGCEKATYTVGTNTRTDTCVFYKEELLNIASPSDQLQQHVKAIIPANSMHTFTADNNKIEWQLKIHGEIPRWPDINYEYPLVVRPLTF